MCSILLATWWWKALHHHCDDLEIGRKKTGMPRKPRSNKQQSIGPSLSYFIGWNFKLFFFPKLEKHPRETGNCWKLTVCFQTNLPSKQKFLYNFQVHQGALLTMKSMMTFMNQSLNAICRHVCLRWVTWRFFLTRQTRLQYWLVFWCRLPYPYPYPYLRISDIHILYIQIDDIYIVYEGWIETPNWCATFGDRIVGFCSC